LNLIPYFSPARTVFSFESYYGPIKEAELKNSIVAFTSYIKEMMLSQILDLGENYFLNIASSILSLKKSELVPAVIQLLENIRSKESILLIKKASQQPGAPFIRAYAHLALYRLGIYQEFDKSTIEFIQESVSKEMISFQPIEMNPQNKIAKNAFQLTPSERSQLLLQTFEALLTRHESSGIELILDSILKGHPNNRYALAGLLLKMIQ
jgi:hypothetical protein